MPWGRELSVRSVCFAECARQQADSAQVLVVNTHLYALHLQSPSGLLPDHDVVILDEAHTVEDIAAAAFGVRLSSARLRRLARLLERLDRDPATPRLLDAAAAGLGAALERATDGRVDTSRGELAAALSQLRDVLQTTASAAATFPATTDDAEAARSQAARQAAQLLDEVNLALQSGSRSSDAPDEAVDRQPSQDDADHHGLLRRVPLVAWVEGSAKTRALHLAPVDVGPLLAARLFSRHTVIAASATLRVGGEFGPTARRLGLSTPDLPWARLLERPGSHARGRASSARSSLVEPRGHDVDSVCLAQQLIASSSRSGRRDRANRHPHRRSGVDLAPIAIQILKLLGREATGIGRGRDAGGWVRGFSDAPLTQRVRLVPFSSRVQVTEGPAYRAVVLSLRPASTISRPSMGRRRP